MSSEIYTDYAIYTTEDLDPQFISTGSDLFASNQALIVLGKRYSSNVTPQIPSWSIEFIGDENEFNRCYIEEAAYYYDDGLAKCRFIKNGNEFRCAINNYFRKAKPISAKAMAEHGITGYSWSEEHNKLVHDHKLQEGTTFPFYSSQRIGFPVDSDDKAKAMIQQALVIKHHSDSPWNTVWEGRPYIWTPR